MAELQTNNNQDELSVHKRWGVIVLSTLWPAIAILIAALVVGFALAMFDINLGYLEDNPVLGLVLNAAVSGLALALAVIPFYRFLTGSRRFKLKNFGITRRLKTIDIVAAGLALIPYFIATSVVIALVGQFVPQIDINQAQQIGFTQPQGLIGYVIVFLALVVLPPVFEELIFRGYMFGLLRRYLSFIATALIVSTIFGLVHGQWNVAVDTFILGMFLSYLREKTGAVWAPILLHALKNGIAFAYLFIIGVN